VSSHEGSNARTRNMSRGASKVMQKEFDKAKLEFPFEGDFVAVRPFKYMSNSPYTPGLTRVNGKLYMIPDWIEVLPETTINDIKAFEEETRGRKKGTKKVDNLTEWRFESKSDPGSYYVVKQVSDYKVSCTCSGQYRAKDRKCRHMKEVMQELGI